MEVRFTFDGELYICGETIEEIKEKWDNIVLFTKEVKENYGADLFNYKAQRIDDNSFDEIDIY